MNLKDIITGAVLIAILAAIFKLLQTSKQHSQMLAAIAIQSGAGHAVQKKLAVKQAQQLEEQDEEEEFEDEEEDEQTDVKKGKKSPKTKEKKFKPTTLQKQIIALFSDGIPKTPSQLRDAYVKDIKPITTTKMNNTISYLKVKGILQTEKVDGKRTYWGPSEWFADELFLEEYAEKIPNKFTTKKQQS